MAIGIVVDDAIVVLENIERWLARGLSVRDATIKAMNEITGPILAITLVLSSVFIPSAFLGGITGQFYRQFALTISASMIISAVNAMTLTPARAAAIFGARRHATPHPNPPPQGGRRKEAPSPLAGEGWGGGNDGREALPWWFFALAGGAASFWLLWPIAANWLGLDGEGESLLGDPGSLRAAVSTWALYALLFIPGAVIGGPIGWLIIRPVNWLLAQVFRGFNWLFDAATRVYARLVGLNLRLSAGVLVLYVVLLGATVAGFFSPRRLHPQPGQGLPDRQHPAARLRRRWSGRKRSWTASRRSPRPSGASPTRWTSPASRS